MIECSYCQTNKRKRMRTKNSAYAMKIGKTWGGTKYKKIMLMIGEYNGYVRGHQLKGAMEINYCPMCGQKLGEREAE